MLLDVAIEVQRAVRSGQASAALAQMFLALGPVPEVGVVPMSAPADVDLASESRHNAASAPLQDDLSDLAQEAEPAGVFTGPASASVRRHCWAVKSDDRAVAMPGCE